MRPSASLLALAAMLGIAVFGVRTIWIALGAANPTLAASLVAGSTTVIVSVLSVLVSRRLDRNTSVLKELRDRKAPVYESLIKYLLSTILSSVTGAPRPAPAAIKEQMLAFTQDLIIWGADDVLCKLHRLRELSLLSSPAEIEQMALVAAAEDLFLAIRKDLGHRNSGLRRGMVLGLVLDDAGRLLRQAPQATISSSGA